MVISIYLGSNKGIPVDATQIECGNPGVGGAQYCMLQLAHYLKKNTSFNLIVLAHRQYIVEDGISFVKIQEISDVCTTAIEFSTDILILNQLENKELERAISKQNKFKVIKWSHNTILSQTCRFIERTSQVKCNVFVGKQQYDRYIDDNVIEKSTHIYNMYHDRTLKVERKNDCRTVVFMGVIGPGKGFRELCSIWHKILEKVPDAKLKVVGAGNLYGDTKLGKYGIAEASYENSFIRYITDDLGNIIPSVEFLGVVGEGKEQIFANASVGVINPSTCTETFGMGVVEMAEVGLPVVTRGRNRYLDTIVDRETGILSNNLSSMADDIVELLTNPSLNEQYGLAAKRNNSRFLPEVIGPQWVKLLNDVYNDNLAIPYLGVSKPFSNNIKWARIIIRFLRYKLRLRFIPSLIKVESLAFNILRG